MLERLKAKLVIARTKRRYRRCVASALSQLAPVEAVIDRLEAENAPETRDRVRKLRQLINNFKLRTRQLDTALEENDMEAISALTGTLDYIVRESKEIADRAIEEG